MPERTDHRDGLVLAGALSNIDIEFIPGVWADTILPKVIPAGHESFDTTPGWVGAWRAHMNALSRVVEENWASALILEDDVDWDVRIKSQLQDFAIGSDYIMRTDNTDPIWYHQMAPGQPPKTSPYGDGWDVLWLGHCGMGLDENETIALRADDFTAPEAHYYRSYIPDGVPPLINYPNHTRAVTAGSEKTCSLAYAVSQAGARKLLYELGMERLSYAFDLMLRNWCEGLNGRQKHACISVMPPLMEHHRPIGAVAADSDITEYNGELRDFAFTLNIRWSVRMNIKKLLQGETDYLDSYPDISPQLYSKP